MHETETTRGELLDIINVIAGQTVREGDVLLAQAIAEVLPAYKVAALTDELEHRGEPTRVED